MAIACQTCRLTVRELVLDCLPLPLVLSLRMLLTLHFFRQSLLLVHPPLAIHRRRILSLLYVKKPMLQFAIAASTAAVITAHRPPSPRSS